MVSKLIRQRFFLGRINFRLHIQNRAARRINFHCRDRSVGISAEKPSLQIQILSWIPINFHYRYRFRARNEKFCNHFGYDAKCKRFGLDFSWTLLPPDTRIPRIKKLLPITRAAGEYTFGCGRPRFVVRTFVTLRLLEKHCTKRFP